MKHLFNTDLSNILNFSILFLTKTNEEYQKYNQMNGKNWYKCVSFDEIEGLWFNKPRKLRKIYERKWNQLSEKKNLEKYRNLKN